MATFIEVPSNKVTITDVVQKNGAPAPEAAASRRRLLQDNAGGLMIDFVVTEISSSIGSKIKQTLQSRTSDLVSLLTQSNSVAFSTLTSASLASPPKFLFGQTSTGGGCQDKVLQKIVQLKASGGDGSDLPTNMRVLVLNCIKEKQLGIDDVITETCKDAYYRVEEIKLQDRFGKPSETANKFVNICVHFEKLVRAQGAGPMSIGMASSVSEINRESPGNGVSYVVYHIKALDVT